MNKEGREGHREAIIKTGHRKIVKARDHSVHHKTGKASKGRRKIEEDKASNDRHKTGKDKIHSGRLKTGKDSSHSSGLTSQVVTGSHNSQTDHNKGLPKIGAINLTGQNKGPIAAKKKI